MTNKFDINFVILPFSFHRYLFYSDKGRKPSKLARIVRAFMDGSSAVDLKLGNMVAPSSITLDSVTRRIYWTDYKLDLIQTADYNGLHR